MPGSVWSIGAVVLALGAAVAGVARAETPLAWPSCGSFGAAESANRNPGELWTFIHGSVGGQFGEPYLAGCTPKALRFEDGQGHRNEMTFRFNEAGRLARGDWSVEQPGGGRFHSAVSLRYTTFGRIEAASYRCSERNGEEAHGFAYDTLGRLERQVGSRPAGCFRDADLAAGFDQTQDFQYEDLRVPHLPSAATVARRLPNQGQIRIAYDYVIDEGGRVARWIERYPSGMWSEKRYVYDAAGRVAMLEVTSREGRHSVQRFDYDAAGRIIVRSDDDGEFRWSLTYRDDGQLSSLIGKMPHWTTGNPLKNLPMTPEYDE